MKKIYRVVSLVWTLFVLASCATTTAPVNPIPTNSGTQIWEDNVLEDEFTEDTWQTSTSIIPQYTLVTNAWKTLIINNFWEDTTISSPLILTGKAPRNWFFEWVFPISILENDGSVIMDWYATGDWMEGVESGEEISWDDMIEFSSTIVFEVPVDVTEWKIQFRADNPSGEAENDDSAEVSIILWE